jgi:hypothetical protein
LFLSEYGHWPDDFSEYIRGSLVMSYYKRKRFEARIMAIEISKIFGSAKPGASSPRFIPQSEMFSKLNISGLDE